MKQILVIWRDEVLNVLSWRDRWVCWYTCFPIFATCCNVLVLLIIIIIIIIFQHQKHMVVMQYPDWVNAVFIQKLELSDGFDVGLKFSKCWIQFCYLAWYWTGNESDTNKGEIMHEVDIMNWVMFVGLLSGTISMHSKGEKVYFWTVYLNRRQIGENINELGLTLRLVVAIA